MSDDKVEPYNGDPWARSNPNPLGDTRPPLRPSKPKPKGVMREGQSEGWERKLRRHGS